MFASLWSWIVRHPEVVAGLSTVLLASFAAVQIGLETWRARRTRMGARIQARGYAWLARRSCEAIFRRAVGEEDAWAWRRSLKGRPWAAMQPNFLAMLRHASQVGGNHGRKAESAFSDLLGFVELMEDPTAFVTEFDGQGKLIPNAAQRRAANAAAQSALRHLDQAITALEVIAPREEHEPRVPREREMPLLLGRQNGGFAPPILMGE